MPTVKLGASPTNRDSKKLYDDLGLTAGDYLEVELYEGRKLLVTPKELVDKHPEIDKRLAEAEEDIKAMSASVGHLRRRTRPVKALRSDTRRKQR